MFSKHRARIKCSTRLNRTTVERLNINSIRETFTQLIYVDTFCGRRWLLGCAGLSGPLPKNRAWKGEKSSFLWWRRRGKPLLNYMIKVNTISVMSVDVLHPEMMWQEGHFTSVVFLPKPYNPSLIMRRTADKPRRGDMILSQYSSRLLRSWTNKERLSNYHRPAEAGETWHLSVMPYFGLAPGTGRGH